VNRRVLIYSPNGTNVHICLMAQGQAESCKIVFTLPRVSSYSLVQTLLLYDVSYSHNAQRHR